MDEKQLLMEWKKCMDANDYAGLMKLVSSVGPAQHAALMKYTYDVVPDSHKVLQQACMAGTQIFNSYNQQESTKTGAPRPQVTVNDAAAAVGNMINVTPSDGGNAT